jgi:hypothetical protein
VEDRLVRLDLDASEAVQAAHVVDAVHAAAESDTAAKIAEG